MRLRTISPLTPPVLACQAMISRSQVSTANTTRATSPFQQPTSKASDDQRWFEAGAITRPSCARMGLVPTLG